MTKKSRQLLIAAMAMTAIFLLFTILIKVVDVQAIGPQQSKVGFATMNGAVATAIGYNQVFYYISTALGVLSYVIAGCFALMGLAQLIATRDIRRVNQRILLLGCLYVAVALLYALFQLLALNYRPVAINGKLAASYPSTHTMVALTVTISAAIALRYVLKDRRMADMLGWICIGIGLLTVLCRLLSGMHWLTDIIGGMILSAALICWFVFGLEMVKERRRSMVWEEDR